MSAALARSAAALGLDTAGDLLCHLPVRYEQYALARPVAELRPGEEATVRVRLESIAVRPTRRRRLRIVQATVADATGRLRATWFNQDYLARVLAPGDELLLRGGVKAGAPPEMTVKAHEVIGRSEGSEGLHTEGLVPVYPASESLPPRRLRELIDQALPAARAGVEVLPVWLRQHLGVVGLADALVAVHAPRDPGEGRAGLRRLAVEELVVLGIALGLLQRHEAERGAAPALEAPGLLADQVARALPFTLTAGQREAIAAIAADLGQTRPMRRLLQGEVGAGKTIVAALAICRAIEADHQAALLVPTETLAEQHVRTLDALLAPAGIRPVLITGRVARAERERREMEIASGTAGAVVGTQALLSEGTRFARLGLVVVDEQHRFGVEQRQILADQTAALAGAGRAAHLLYMTATPIPRTLALTAFGDLTVSSIRGRPPGRGPVATRWVAEDERAAAYEEVRGELRAGRQAYVICPAIQAEEEGGTGRRSAVQEAERLQGGPFAAFRVGLVHGAQRSDDKRTAMLAFEAGKLDLLVATTVVEVGIDVPNATVMVIEDADRFGLAQLHQLRGRVGRGTSPGICLVFGEPTTDDGARRLEALTQTNDGFALAQLDLEIRGEGSLMGARQAGATDLRFARIGRDAAEIERAFRAAAMVLERDPHLADPEHRLLRTAVEERFALLPRVIEA